MYNLGETKIIVQCDAREVEEIIQKEYGFKEYSIVASEECGNYCSLEFAVSGEAIDINFEYIEAKKEMWMTRVYLNDLARRGKIQKGDYVVDVSW